MAIDAATVRKVARLARIAEPDDRIEQLAKELNGIMTWIEQLGEVDTDGVEPMASAVQTPLPMRDDVVTEGGDPEKVLSNAPRRAGDFYVVPKVVE
ncbi:Asp-tRNA(Asn)/Glu-tRNA(Gln) amidotransferase subunit GatC [Phenylobacterium sp.]|uniref:Asp-tRNA(Asn)/Glu-tRNA(Gln) amidotransferase subunit GatC n=1 Tax=Phenylobacterium sp. TaxID=1871053 RepID=UPI00120D22F6|nr:Asp-tRNA(Asn)/Glu-tRNA(Gln) amidotransferase subunit GatC [Phenylobacterium sp.]THD64987.1 MAG: Asp-tRNA(Asn)/Glu-tRNA(Gln) amidotransferase subunit GatC [Phenylobacterium sp.]